MLSGGAGIEQINALLTVPSEFIRGRTNNCRSGGRLEAQLLPKGVPGLVDIGKGILGFGANCRRIVGHRPARPGLPAIG